jgi:hypothetical protein
MYMVHAGFTIGVVDHRVAFPFFVSYLGCGCTWCRGVGPHAQTPRDRQQVCACRVGGDGSLDARC